MEILNYDKLHNTNSKIKVNSGSFTRHGEEYLIPLQKIIENQWPKFITIRIVLFSLISPNEIKIHAELLIQDNYLNEKRVSFWSLKIRITRWLKIN